MAGFYTITNRTNGPLEGVLPYVNPDSSGNDFYAAEINAVIPGPYAF